MVRRGRGSRHAIGWPGPASPADTANIFRLYVTAAAARAFLYVQDATSAVRDVTTVVSCRLGPCLTLPEPASTMFSHFHLVVYLRRCLVPALKSFPCVFVYVYLSVFNIVTCESLKCFILEILGIVLLKIVVQYKQV